MPGPVAKRPGQRRRRNRPQVAAVLPSLPVVAVPEPPEGLSEPMLGWWATVWRSPMAAMWVESDVFGLERLAGILEVALQGAAPAALLAEARQLEDRFGLSPMARRRLQWQIGATDAAVDAEVIDAEERWLRVVSE
jgi:hypothetical protein